MKKHYIDLGNGKTDGPYSLRALELFYNRKKITIDTLVCEEGGNWMPYESVLKKEGKGSQVSQSDDSNSQIAGAFRGVGIVCFVLAVVIPLLLLAGKNSQPVFAAALFLVLALSGLGWLGVGVIIRLLEQIAENTGKR